MNAFQHVHLTERVLAEVKYHRVCFESFLAEVLNQTQTFMVDFTIKIDRRNNDLSILLKICDTDKFTLNIWPIVLF